MRRFPRQPRHHLRALADDVGGSIAHPRLYEGQGDAMVPTTPPADIAELPPPPRNPLTLRQQIHAVKAFHTGQEVLRDAGGHVTRLKHGPTWFMPEAGGADSPQPGRRKSRRDPHGA